MNITMAEKMLIQHVCVTASVDPNMQILSA